MQTSREFPCAAGGPDWVRSYNWLNFTAGVCSWYGLVCCPDSGLIEIDVNLGTATYSATDSGTAAQNKAISSAITFFECATVGAVVGVQLQQNNITISVANVSAFPSLTSTLQYMDLSGNHLFGAMPPDLSFGLLGTLNLQHNDITGRLPPGLFANEVLAALLVEGNRCAAKHARHWRSSISWCNKPAVPLAFYRLTGTIPSLVNVSQSLRIFSASYNQLTGPLPEGWLASSSTDKVCSLTQPADRQHCCGSKRLSTR